MTYAPDHRPFYDADSHVMEYPTFITDYADPEFRDRIPEVDYTASIVTDEEVDEMIKVAQLMPSFEIHVVFIPKLPFSCHCC